MLKIFAKGNAMKSTAVLCAALIAAIALPTFTRAAGPATRPATPATRPANLPTKATTQPAKTLTLDLGNKVTLKLALVPAGKFMMGSSESEQKDAVKFAAAAGANEDYAKNWFRVESPQHEVTISKPFYMGIYDVTQEHYEQVMGRNPANFKGPQNPVEMVSWDDAVEFCKKVSASTGRTVRLPTEAEWEYGCRAGTKSPFGTGETISTAQANFDGNYTYGNGAKGEYRQKTTAAGSFKANAFGLYDMHGNVWQWCADWYEENYYGNSPKVDPAGPADGRVRALRGGCWNSRPWHCRAALRSGGSPGSKDAYGGFRVAVSVD
jgi:formylglycine-generating enzyme required for sulfatase activity